MKSLEALKEIGEFEVDYIDGEDIIMQNSEFFKPYFEIVKQDLEILEKYKSIEEELGCPIEVRLNVNCDTKIYDEDGVEYNVDYIYKNNFICHNGTCDDYGIDYEFTFYWKDYKKNWFLNEDRSE